MNSTSKTKIGFTQQETSNNPAVTPSRQLVSERDYFELSRLVNEHTWRVDNGYADTVYELYTEDGELNVPPAPIRGHQALREWGRELVNGAPWKTIRHVGANMRFVMDGPNAAIGTTVLTVFMFAGQGQATTLPWSVGEDHDRYVRTENGWKIASRNWVELFSRGDNVL
jgi:hypothetical protein